jgi:hypothetical protein
MRRQEHHRLEPAKEKSHDNFDRPNDGRNDWQERHARTYLTGTGSDNANTQANNDSGENERTDDNTGALSNGRVLPERVLEPGEEERRLDLEEKEKDENYKILKQQWKKQHPDQNVKFWKEQYIKGKIDKLPWVNE